MQRAHHPSQARLQLRPPGQEPDHPLGRRSRAIRPPPTEVEEVKTSGEAGANMMAVAGGSFMSIFVSKTATS